MGGLKDRRKYNSPVLQFGAPPAIDSGEAKMHIASWENVDKQNASQYEITHKHVSNGLKMWIKRLHTKIPRYNNNLHSLQIYLL